MGKFIITGQTRSIVSAEAQKRDHWTYKGKMWDAATNFLRGGNYTASVKTAKLFANIRLLLSPQSKTTTPFVLLHANVGGRDKKRPRKEKKKKKVGRRKSVDGPKNIHCIS